MTPDPKKCVILVPIGGHIEATGGSQSSATEVTSTSCDGSWTASDTPPAGDWQYVAKAEVYGRWSNYSSPESMFVDLTAPTGQRWSWHGCFAHESQIGWLDGWSG